MLSVKCPFEIKPSDNFVFDYVSGLLFCISLFYIVLEISFLTLSLSSLYKYGHDRHGMICFVDRKFGPNRLR